MKSQWRRTLVVLAGGMLLGAWLRPQAAAYYRATDRLWRRGHVLPGGTPEVVADALLRTHPELLEAALDAAIAPHGDLGGLLAFGLGLDGSRLDALRKALLE